MESTGPIQHIFVDFENVQAIDLSTLGRKPVHVTLLIGANQKQLEVGLVQQLLEHAAKVQLVRLASSGRNALDFALAYYLGRAAVIDPTGSFRIISKDKGFEPLIAHLQENQISVTRHDTFTPDPGSSAGRPVDPEDKVGIVIESLQRNATARPKRRTSLLKHIDSHFTKKLKLGEADAAEIVDALVARRFVEIDPKGIVGYLSPADDDVPF